MTDKLTYEQILSRFVIEKRQGDKAQAKCQGHDDRKGSLSIELKGDKVVMFCHAGCLLDAVLASVDLKITDLFLNSSQKPESLYQYHNEDGSLAYEKEKYRNADGSKDFIYRHTTTEGTLSYTKGDKRILYRYLQYKEAVSKGDLIIYPEGEKDCNTAIALGYPATTMGGASDWKPEYALLFKGARLVIAFDKDKAGIDLTVKMIDSLKPVCTSLKVIVLSGSAKDLSEWVCQGHNRQELDQLIASAPELAIKKNTSDKFDWHDHAITHTDLLQKHLEPISFLVEDILVDTGTGILAGRKKLGKSFGAIQLSICVAGGANFLGHRVKQGKVVHFALEDGERRTQSRLRMQHADKALPITYFYKWPAWNTPAGFNQLRMMLLELKPALVVVDTFAKILDGKPDQNAAGAMADFGNRIHDLALELNIMFLFIAHHGKGLQMTTRDPGFDIRGSSAIPGATDVNIGLYKNEDSTFELIGEGRDIPEFDFRVSFDKEQTWAWHMEGEAVDLRRKEAEAKIIGALELLGEADASAIAKQTDTSRVAVNGHLKRMREYTNSPISYEVKGKNITYSLTTLTTLTDLQELLPLQEDITEKDCKGTVRVAGGNKSKANHARPVSVVREVTNNGKVCPFCGSNKLVKQPDGEYYCKSCSNCLSESELKEGE